MKNILHAFSLGLFVLVCVLACDSGNPVAPEPTPTPDTSTFRITLTAEPSQLEISSNDSSTITVAVTRRADNQPAEDGTAVTLSTTLGDFGSDAGGPVTLTQLSLAGGRAQASLSPSSEAGSASLLARAGDSLGDLVVSMVEPTAPTLINVVPNLGNPDGGETVTIEGEGFREPLRVSFGGSAAQVVEVPSLRQIKVVTPPSTMEVPSGGAVAVDVAVTVRLDQAEPPMATLTGGFLYVADEVPPLFLTAVRPPTGDHQGGEQVVITGGGFDEPLRVTFGTALATVISAGNSQIRVVVPSAEMPVAAGEQLAVDVTVTNALDQPEPLSAVLMNGFTYFNGDPRLFLSEVVPSSGDADGGETVRLLGGGFRSPVQVDFGGQPGSMARVVSTGEISVVAPAPAMVVGVGEQLLVDVTVTNAVDEASPQSVSLMNAYTYEGAAAAATPQVFSAVPNFGVNEGGTEVTLTGADFEDPVDVLIGGTIADATFLSPTELTAVTPRASQGNRNMAVDVTVRNRNTGQEGTLAGGFTYGEEILVTSLEPSEGTYLGETEVTLRGQGFTSPVSVELAGIGQQNETWVSESEVTFETTGVAISACPESGQVPQTGVTVTNVGSGNSGSAMLTFTYLVPLPVVSRVAPSFGPQLGNQLVTLEGENFAPSARVLFVADMEEFTASVDSVDDDGTQVRVTSPRLPDSVFPEVECTTDANEAGKRFAQITVDVRVINLDTLCEDVFSNSYTYDPSDKSCRPNPPSR